MEPGGLQNASSDRWLDNIAAYYNVYTNSLATKDRLLVDFNAEDVPELEKWFGAKLNPAVFDYMTIDERRRRLMPKPEDWDQGTELNSKEARRLNTGIYKGQETRPNDFRIPELTYAADHPAEDLPAFHFAYEVKAGGAAAER